VTEITAISDTTVVQRQADVTRNDRFSAILVVLVSIGAFGIGLFLRQQASGQTWLYTNPEAGIEARYPAGWLSDESGTYLARLRDPKARPFKTQFVLSVFPAGGQTSIRNIVDTVTLQRSVTLPAYRVLNINRIGSGDQAVTQMDFVFVDEDPNPFIERLPVVVRGTDRIVLDGNRAIVATFLSEQSSYTDNLPLFDRFMASLRY